MKILKLIGGVLTALFVIAASYYYYQDFEHVILDNDYRVNHGGSYIELKEGVTYYELKGSENSETVVLVHGYGIASYVWEPTVQFLLNNGYRVLRLDLYGHGTSDRPDAIYGIELFSEQLNNLLVKLNIEKPFHLLGLSMGGSVVTGFTAKYPNKVKTLILQDPLVQNINPAIIYPLNIPYIGEYLYGVYLMPLNVQLRPNQSGKGIVYETYGDKYMEQAEINGFRRAMLSGLRYMATHNYEVEYQKMAKTTMPKLLIWGTEDKTIPIENAKILIDLMPRLKFEKIEGAGHVPSMEVPEKFNTILLSWLIKNKSV